MSESEFTNFQHEQNSKDSIILKVPDSDKGIGKNDVRSLSHEEFWILVARILTADPLCLNHGLAD